MVDVGYEIFDFMSFVFFEEDYLLFVLHYILQLSDRGYWGVYFMVKIFCLFGSKGKIIMKSIVFFIKFSDLTLKIFFFCDEFSFSMFEVFLMHVIIDISTKKLFDCFFFLKNLFILICK